MFFPKNICMLLFIDMHINNHLIKHLYLCYFFLRINFSCKQRCYRNYYKMYEKEDEIKKPMNVTVSFDFENKICRCGNRKKCDWLRWDEDWGGEWRSDENHCGTMEKTTTKIQTITDVNIKSAHLLCNDNDFEHRFM